MQLYNHLSFIVYRFTWKLKGKEVRKAVDSSRTRTSAAGNKK